jgi:ComF family protein
MNNKAGKADNKTSLPGGLSKKIFNAAIHLIWPASCINCRQPVDSDILCSRCFGELTFLSHGQYCRRCGRDGSAYGQVGGCCPVCQGEDIIFDAIARGGLYAGALRRLILSFKNGATELESTLGFMLNSALEGSGFLAEVEYFVPVPLHWTRRIKRGFNHSLVLTGHLGASQAAISTDLVRIRRTKMQTVFSSPAGRAKNVAGAFALRRGHKLSGKKVCLVDDIKTTGATLNECAKTLKQAGVLRVYAVVLAVAGQDNT